jgi:hypothetical protein
MATKAAVPRQNVEISHRQCHTKLCGFRCGGGIESRSIFSHFEDRGICCGGGVDSRSILECCACLSGVDERDGAAVVRGRRSYAFRSIWPGIISTTVEYMYRIVGRSWSDPVALVQAAPSQDIPRRWFRPPIVFGKDLRPAYMQICPGLSAPLHSLINIYRPREPRKDVISRPVVRWKWWS